MNQLEMMQIVEHYCRKAEPADGQVKITRVPDSKTTFVETVGA